MHIELDQAQAVSSHPVCQPRRGLCFASGRRSSSNALTTQKGFFPPMDTSSEMEIKHQKVTEALRGLGYTPDDAEEMWAGKDHSLSGEQIFLRALDRAGYKPQATDSSNGQEPPPAAKSPPPKAASGAPITKRNEPTGRRRRRFMSGSVN
jgi:hypothetical protein